MTSCGKPTIDFVKEALSKLTNISLREHFYLNLKNPNWVEPLFQLGVYSNPPAPVIDGKYTQFPHWPELEFVSRVANDAPEIAFKCVQQLKTDNIFIQRTALDIASKLPNTLLSEFVNNTLLKWYSGNSPIPSLTASQITKICKRLAEEGHPTAIEIVDKLILTFRHVPNEFFEGVQSKFSEKWDFEQALKAINNPMVEAFGEKYFEILCQKLNQIVRIDQGNNTERSIIWRSAIEDHDQDEFKDETKNLIVSAVRDAATRLISEGNMKVIPILAKFNPSIFTRIKIYLSSRYGQLSNSVLGIILDPSNFWGLELHREIYQFLESQFQQLEISTQTHIVNLIKAGPDDEKYADSEKARKLASIKHFLDPDTLKEFENLPSIQYPDFHFYSEGANWVGPTSPYSLDEIQKLSVSEIIKLIADWSPTDNWRKPTPRGFAREIENDVKASPEKYLSEIERFSEVGPTYCSQILMGLRSLEKDQFPNMYWDRLLKFMEAIVAKPIQLDQQIVRFDNFDEDQDWKWARQCIVTFLSSKMRSCPTSFKLRIFTLICTIYKDDQNLAVREQGVSDQGSIYGLAINSAKGEALGAAIEYGLWQWEVNNEQTSSELFHFLDQVVNENFDDLLIPRAVLGRYYPWLHLLSPSWAGSNVDSVFPETELDCFSASWLSYINHCDPYNEMLSLLRNKYKFALVRYEDIITERGYYADRLASHIVTYYLRSEIPIDDELIELLLSKRTNKHVFTFIGRCLDGKDVSDNILSRSVALWEKYLNRFNSNNVELSDEDKESLSGFTYCAENLQLDTNWKLSNLHRIFEMGVQAKDGIGVIRCMQSSSVTHISETLSLLKTCIVNNSIHHVYLMHQNELREILTKGKNSGIKTAIKLTNDIVNLLGERGYRGFFDLHS